MNRVKFNFAFIYVLISKASGQLQSKHEYQKQQQ